MGVIFHEHGRVKRRPRKTMTQSAHKTNQRCAAAEEEIRRPREVGVNEEDGSGGGANNDRRLYFLIGNNANH